MKKIFTSILCTVLSLIMILPVIAEDSDSISFDAKLLSTADLTVSEWCETNEMRALFVIGSILELSQNVDEIGSISDTLGSIAIEAITNNTVYIANKSLTVHAFFWGDEELFRIEYVPVIGKAAVSKLSTGNLSSTAIEAMMITLVDKAHLTSYHHVDSELILSNLAEFLNK